MLGQVFTQGSSREAELLAEVVAAVQSAHASQLDCRDRFRFKAFSSLHPPHGAKRQKMAAGSPHKHDSSNTIPTSTATPATAATLPLLSTKTTTSTCRFCCPFQRPDDHLGAPLQEQPVGQQLPHRPMPPPMQVVVSAPLRIKLGTKICTECSASRGASRW